jgi:PAS domain S-box-containing protein
LLSDVGTKGTMTEPLRLLLLDEEESRLAVRRMLAAAAVEGIELIDAPPGNFSAAEAQRDAARVDCVLAGHHPPVLDARALLHAVRDGAGLRAPPVIIFTGQGDEHLAVELMKGGASDYLIRGAVSGEQLARRVRAAVRVHRAEVAAAAAQLNLLAASRARDEAVALLDTLVGGAPVGIAFFDTELRYVRVNRELARINGLSVEAHLGKTLAEALPHMNPQVAIDLGEVLRSGVPVINIDVTGETPADPGVPHDWIVSYYPVRSAAGETLGVGATVIDITDRKRHQRELAQAKEAAEAANRSKDQFLAVLSHELRTPLTPVLLAVQALQEGDAQLPEDLRGMLAMIRRNVELEARLIDDLLDLTRISKGKLQLHLEMIDAHDLITSALEICRGEIDGKGIHVQVDLAARRHVVYADGARLQQVFWNLINNAVKFTPAGGTLKLRSFDEDERLVAQVSDSGIGIDAQTLPRIFDAFEQGEGTITRRFGGLGLGLAICRALMRMHWGVIQASSEGKGKGATFTIKLTGHPPASVVRGGRHEGTEALGNRRHEGTEALGISRHEGTEARRHGGGIGEKEASEAAEASSSPSSLSPALAPACVGASVPSGLPTPPRRRILMVDDHADTRAAMKRLLERSGYHVTTADSVKGAIQGTGDQPIDILISDIGLPDGSGLEIMRHFRHRAAPPCAPGAQQAPPVRGIALSGFGMEEDIRRSREAGFEHHLTKPVTFDRLRAVLKQIEAGTTTGR